MTQASATQPRKPIAWGRYLLLLGLAAWMFILGFLVGQDKAPVTFDTQGLQEQLANLRESMVAKERDTILSGLEGESESPIPGFYEDLKKDGPDTSVDDTSGRPGTLKDRAATPPHKTRGPLMAKKKNIAIKPAKSSPAKISGTTSPSKGDLTIQIEALKDFKTAQQKVKRFKKEGYAAYLSMHIDTKKTRWYRIRVGRYENEKQAAADLKRLARDHKNLIIVHAEAK